MKQQKKNYVVHVSGIMLQRAKYLEKMSTKEYRDLARMCNAIEGIPSVLRRRYHIDNIPTYVVARTGFFGHCVYGNGL